MFGQAPVYPQRTLSIRERAAHKGSEASDRDVRANMSFKEVILMSEVNYHWEYFLSQLSR